MTQRAPDPRRLDVAAFAAQAQALDGSWPVAGMPRLLDSIDARAESNGSAAVVWHAAGEQTPPRGDAPRVWLRLAASAQVTMTCQRCLGPLAVPLAVERTFGFVAGEAQAAALDADSDDDVLALERWLDLHTLVEDELLLALPLVPRHADCAPPAVRDDAVAAAPGEPAREHPFAALAALRRKAH